MKTVLMIMTALLISTSAYAVVDQLDDGTWIEVNDDGTWHKIEDPAITAQRVEQEEVRSAASSTKEGAIKICKAEIDARFDPSVTVRFPEPLVTENQDAFIIRYMHGQKLYTGENTRVNAVCTIFKDGSYTWINVAGKGIETRY